MDVTVINVSTTGGFIEAKCWIYGLFIVVS